MDGGGRLAGSLSETVPSRPAEAGTARPVSRRRRAERRGSDGARPRDAPGGRRGLARRLDRMADCLSRLPRHAGLAAAALIVAASAGYGTVRGGHVGKIVDVFKQLRDMGANAAGFNIAAVALSGQKHLTREEILATAGVTGRASLLFFDVADARARLLTNPWIAAATVQKLLPDRLVIAITERQAFALWQKAGRVGVIADDGTVLEPYVLRRYANLPLVVGNGAETRAKEFLAVLDRRPELRANVRASVLVAERRWNLRLKSGVDVRLPEFDREHALDQLAALERDSKLSGRDIASVDLRLPDRITVRLSEAAVQARDEAQKKKQQQQKPKGGSA
jgi:cell division protein FtsQ